MNANVSRRRMKTPDVPLGDENGSEKERKKERKNDWCDADPRRRMCVSILRREEINPRR